MAFRLPRDRPVDRCAQNLVAFRGPQGRAQIGRILLTQAHEQRARAGHADAVAALAEIVRERRDEAEAPAGLPYPDVAGRPARGVGDILEREAVEELRPQDGERQVLVDPVPRDLAERTGGPARYVRVKETGGKLGLITPLTHNFCESCNRVRLTCTGTLYMCLGQNDAAEFRDLMRSTDDNTVLSQAIDEAISRKPKGHDFIIDRTRNKPAVARHMSVTGG